MNWDSKIRKRKKSKPLFWSQGVKKTMFSPNSFPPPRALLVLPSVLLLAFSFHVESALTWELWWKGDWTLLVDVDCCGWLLITVVVGVAVAAVVDLPLNLAVESIIYLSCEHLQILPVGSLARLYLLVVYLIVLFDRVEERQWDRQTYQQTEK